jgi:hypothetical protein
VALEHQEEVVYLGGALRLLEVGASLQVGAAAFRQEVEVVAFLQEGVAAFHQVVVGASLQVVGGAAFHQVVVVACLQEGAAAYHQVAVAVASLRVVVVYLDLLVAQLQNLR